MNLNLIEERIIIKETNMLLKVDGKKYVKLARNTILKERMQLENYILRNPIFLTTFEPIDVEEDAPKIVKLMARASKNANVGPMAAVAGTISQLVMENLLKYGSRNVIAENGGDIALRCEKDVVVGLFAGTSPLSGEVGFKLKKEKIKNGYGVCTSSGTVGHSVSFGNADAVVVFAKEASIADAAATSIGNYAVGKEDEAINRCLEKAEEIENIDGVLVVVGKYAGKIGKIPQLVKTDKKAVLSEFFEII
ncbi:UPF0280 family protein [Methanotorris igneus]|uniref:UPF0280 protein Metig_0710 n=1 Tax=Methanotorris igneus (strain DSM 5666 / JCM 11834 / Kol 5) TaxID=880724 RepID=F6BCP9_METIK|nr:UPF0280 family protein [Methanotorris igneus]AEF96260.1 UPF0280 protein [Methanotorris igneus Kol 5]